MLLVGPAGNIEIVAAGEVDKPRAPPTLGSTLSDVAGLKFVGAVNGMRCGG